MYQQMTNDDNTVMNIQMQHPYGPPHPAIPRGYVHFRGFFLGVGIFYIVMAVIFLATSPFTLFGGGNVAFFTALGVLSICLKRRPGNYGILVSTMVLNIVSMITCMIFTNLMAMIFGSPVIIPCFVLGYVTFIVLCVHLGFNIYECCWCCHMRRRPDGTVMIGETNYNDGIVISTQPTAQQYHYNANAIHPQSTAHQFNQTCPLSNQSGFNAPYQLSANQNVNQQYYQPGSNPTPNQQYYQPGSNPTPNQQYYQPGNNPNINQQIHQQQGPYQVDPNQWASGSSANVVQQPQQIDNDKSNNPPPYAPSQEQSSAPPK
jgi:hypothetical protein